ncbi:antibiotic biosynthesis monooxygenase [Rhodococcus sp. ACPA1]|uniref:antibiotic biosynthesis monooxygenase n=1 Tax=Rhodococcus sp. ACPA1 TaxID=2028572 RepID=UPI000BB16695|nr:antibiotic biosynthesis monooxygenase [Rhodococcus sp. ACPA1]PBC54507.1 antibiotic biosynthesis monooxygenase [Rhodococcus sp. ACPA1]RZK86037.1 MAG: antibiotic biosynthesis monooxygenase [Rhodococcus sp. (in: high G+C Gram-positive bacteria)]
MDTEKPTEKSTGNAATVIIGQKVRAGSEEAFEAWQQDMNTAASHYPGFLGAEISAPTAVQPDWVVVYRFDSVAHVQAWINSATRQHRLDEGQQYFDGPATQQVISGGTRESDPLVTVVVTHRVGPEHVDDFLAWQDRLRLEESKFDGFRGSELFRPIEGVQDEWTALYRYDNAADLDRWLTSAKRQELLAEGEKFHDFELRTIDNSFGSWFAFDENGNEAPPPSETKTSIAVWVGLYPTVVILTLALSPLKMPLWLGLLVGNLLSSFIMSFVTMPYYVNRVLGRWLRPPPDVPEAATNRRGIAIVAGVMVFWVIVFYLLTRQFWTLP